MPIAHCIVTPECQPTGSEDLVALWAAEAQQSPEHMTINIITSTQQHGAAYSVMAQLFLPSLWSRTHISVLQTGLARALARYFRITTEHVHVITHIIPSGYVVEKGEEMIW